MAGNVGAGIGGAATAGWEFGTGLVSGLVDLGLCAIPIEGLGCSPAQLASDLATDWDGTTTAIAHQAAQGIGNARADLLSGDPFRVSHSVTGVFLFVGSVGAGKVVKAPAGAGAGADAIQPASSVGRAGSYLDDVGRGCAHSFAAATLVRTADGGVRPIAELAVDDEVLALDPDTGTTGTYAISATFVHDDPVTGSVEIDGEAIATTPGHAFLTVERGWVEARDLQPGEHVPSIAGGNGVVGAITWDGGRATMYDLTVETVHTFAVGTGGWVVHNCAVDDIGPTLDRIRRSERHPHANDGTVFRNQEGRLPRQPDGYYAEFVHPTPAVQGAGMQRIVIGRGGETWLSTDHYRSFWPIPGRR